MSPRYFPLTFAKPFDFLKSKFLPRNQNYVHIHINNSQDLTKIAMNTISMYTLNTITSIFSFILFKRYKTVNIPWIK